MDEVLGLIHPIRSERPPDPPRRGVSGAIKRVPGGARRAEVRRLGPAGASVATAAKAAVEGEEIQRAGRGAHEGGEGVGGERVPISGLTTTNQGNDLDPSGGVTGGGPPRRPAPRSAERGATFTCLLTPRSRSRSNETRRSSPALDLSCDLGVSCGQADLDGSKPALEAVFRSVDPCGSPREGAVYGPKLLRDLLKNRPIFPSLWTRLWSALWNPHPTAGMERQ